jgi:branched-chain amino acid transport system substrate-binding protein
VNEIAKQRNKILIANAPAARRLTNEDCAPYTVHYTYDNYALAKGTGEASVKAGYDSWFFITADNVFGKDLEAITSAFVTKNGGKVLGSVRVPLNTPDFSSYLLQAQSSPEVIGLGILAPTQLTRSSRAPSLALKVRPETLAQRTLQT